MATVHTKVAWGRLFIYYLIAFVVSGLFNSGVLTPLYQKLTNGLIIKNWSFLPAGIGTMAAALIAFKFDKKLNRTITLLGNNNKKTILYPLFQ